MDQNNNELKKQVPGSVPPKRPQVALLAFFLVPIGLFIAPRLSGLVTLLILILLYGCFPLHQSRRAVDFALIISILCILSPVDFDIGGFHGIYYGDHRKGVLLVRLVHGLPKVDVCLARYGEFIAGGCVGHGYDSTWILKWD